MNPAPHTREKNYFVNPFIDLLTAGGGFSILLLPFLYFLGSPERSPELVRIAVAASFLINYPHFAATLYRLYHNKENRTTYRFTTQIIPFIFLFTFALALRSPQFLGAYYCKIFLIWSGYHY